MTGADFGGVDIDLLADYIGGALTGTPEESAVAARIADDPDWQAAYASLGEGMSFVTAELGRLAPEPMPADLATRLDAALSAAAPLDGRTSQAADASSPFHDAAWTESLAPSSTTHDAAWTGPADESTSTHDATRAGSVDESTSTHDATRAGSVDASSTTHDAARGGADDGAIADPTPIAPGLAKPPEPHLTLVRGGRAGGGGAPGVRKTQPAPRRGRRLRWAAPIAVAAGLIAFVGFGLDYLAGRDNNAASTDSAAGSGVAAQGEAPKFATSGSAQTLASGTDYTHATLGIAPPQPLSGGLSSPDTPGRKSTPEMAGGVESALRRLTAPTALAECLAAIEKANGGGPLSAETVDYALFDGSPAVIVRFTAGNVQWAWASGADCGTRAGGAATLDKVPVG